MTTKYSRHPLAITMGDPAGVGGEIILKAWADRQNHSLPAFFAIDNLKHLETTASNLGLDIVFHSIQSPDEALSCFDTVFPVLEQSLTTPPSPGSSNPDNAPAIIASIDRAVEFAMTGHANGVVTNPIHKKSLYEAGFTHPGHTEYLAALAKINTPPVMMLATGELRVIPVTIHVSVAEAVRTLNTASIVELGGITAKALQRDFGIANPRIAVAGLNPHAGEGGSMGTEEIEIIEPAIKELNRRGITTTGPYPPDTLFTERARKTYDAALCMYHDQALIPIKTLDFDGGVNVTLGLPFIRTSPDHGTAFDIAGTGQANERSLVTAIKTADLMAQNRARNT